MKQKQSVEGVLRSSKPSIKKVGTMLGSGAMAVLAIGAISVYGLSDKTEISGRETKAATEYNAVAVQAAEEERIPAYTCASSATVSWWKAGVEEYEFAENAVTTVTAEKAKKSETSETEKTKASAETARSEKKSESSKVKAADVKAMYTAEAVNMRKGPSKSSDVITVLDAGTKVNCTGKTDDGWYRVEFSGTEGYCMAEYLTANAPVKETAAKTQKVTESKTNTTASAADTTKKTTTEKSDNSERSVISYTDEEFEMMCYVLQGEVGGCSDASKIAVANVIINRVKSSRFPDSIKGVLTAPNQFTAISAYYNKTNAPSKNTKDCAKRALNGEGADASKGATYYYAPKYCSGSSAAWFESLTFCMELEGQRFFKN